MTTTLQDLKQLRQWVGWRSVLREGADKPTKVPMNPHTAGAASTVDPATWATAQEAWQAKSRYGWTGIGFVFTIESGIVGVDLDNCFDGAHLRPWAREIVQMLDSYTEKSPSGNGLHILVKGTIEHSINRSKTGVEIYDEGRYFTVTGRVFGQKEPKPIQERQTELDALYAVFQDDHEPQPKLATRTPFQSQPVDRRELERALTYIPPQGDYYDWLRVLMGIHDAFPGSEGVAIAEAWSPGYRGEVQRKFNSFRHGDGVSVGTVFHMAKEHGYSPPKPERPVYQKRQSWADRSKALMTGESDATRAGSKLYTLAA